MSKQYNDEFKKQVVDEYLKGVNYAKLEREYEVAKSTVAGWVKSIAENANIINHKAKTALNVQKKLEY